MNIHDKLFFAMLSICEDFINDHNYEYYQLNEYYKSMMTEEQFKEITELVNTDWENTAELNSSCFNCKES